MLPERSILPRQGEVSPKVTEGEDTEPTFGFPPPPSGKSQPPPPGGGGSRNHFNAAQAVWMRVQASRSSASEVA